MLTLYLVNIAVIIGFIFLAWKKPGLALWLLIPVVMGILLSMMAYYDNEIYGEYFFMHLPSIFLLPVILIIIAICVIHWGPTSSQIEDPWYKSITSMILSIAKFILICVVFVAVFKFFSPILFMLMIISVFQFTQAQKYGLIIDVISTIGTSIRQSLPLPMSLATAAHGQNQKEAKVFNDIAYWLSVGKPLSQAMQAGYPKCPSNILASISAAEKLNQLPEAIESLNNDLNEKIEDCKTPKPIQPWYPAVVLVLVISLMMVLSIRVIPVFAEVLCDTSEGQASLPAATQSLVDISDWMLGRDGLNTVMVIIAFSGCATLFFYTFFSRRNPTDQRFLSRLGDTIKWKTPVIHWFEKTFSNLYLVQIFHVGLIAGYPVNTILRNALELDVNNCYRNQLQKWLKKIEAGEDISHSATASGLDKTLAWAFDQRINKGNTPVILEGLEEVYRQKYHYRKNVLASACMPLIILSLGLVVGWVVYAMFIAVVSTITFTLQYTIPQ